MQPHKALRALRLVPAVWLGVTAPAAAQPKPPAPAVAEARRLEAIVSGVAERAAASVVTVLVSLRDDAEGRFVGRLARGQSGPLAGAGSGVVVSADSIVTNNHIVEDALAIRVRLQDGRVLPAKLVGRDPATDLALLRVEATALTPARPDPSEPKPGQLVVAVGSPFGSGITLAAGHVASKPRSATSFASVEDAYLLDTDITPTVSGGPAFDLEGRIVGVSSAALSRSAGAGVVVPAAAMRRVLPELQKSGRVVRPSLGAMLQDLTPDLATALKAPDLKSGAIVTQVNDGGAARKANLEVGDLIATAGGKPVRDASDVEREVLGRDAGQTLALEVVRQGKRYATQVTLLPRTDPPLGLVPAQQEGVAQVGLGFNVRDLTREEAGRRGLPAKALPVVTTVIPGSAADRAGLRVDDVVVEADGTVEGTTKELLAASADGKVVLRLRRRDQTYYAALSR